MGCRTGGWTRPDSRRGKSWRAASCGLLLCAACLTAPAVPAPEVSPTRLTALASGPLTIAGACLRLNEYALAWPPEFTVAVNGGQVEVTDGLTGEHAVWQAGQEIQLGGGEVGLPGLAPAVRDRLQAACGADIASIWLVGGLVHPPSASQVP